MNMRKNNNIYKIEILHIKYFFINIAIFFFNQFQYKQINSNREKTAFIKISNMI